MPKGPPPRPQNSIQNPFGSEQSELPATLKSMVKNIPVSIGESKDDSSVEIPWFDFNEEIPRPKLNRSSTFGELEDKDFKNYMFFYPENHDPDEEEEAEVGETGIASRGRTRKRGKERRVRKLLESPFRQNATGREYHLEIPPAATTTITMDAPPALSAPSPEAKEKGTLSRVGLSTTTGSTGFSNAGMSTKQNIQRHHDNQPPPQPQQHQRQQNQQKQQDSPRRQRPPSRLKSSRGSTETSTKPAVTTPLKTRVRNNSCSSENVRQQLKPGAPPPRAKPHQKHEQKGGSIEHLTSVGQAKHAQEQRHGEKSRGGNSKGSKSRGSSSSAPLRKASSSRQPPLSNSKQEAREARGSSKTRQQQKLQVKKEKTGGEEGKEASRTNPTQLDAAPVVLEKEEEGEVALKTALSSTRIWLESWGDDDNLDLELRASLNDTPRPSLERRASLGTTPEKRGPPLDDTPRVSSVSSTSFANDAAWARAASLVHNPHGTLSHSPPSTPPPAAVPTPPRTLSSSSSSSSFSFTRAAAARLRNQDNPAIIQDDGSVLAALVDALRAHDLADEASLDKLAGLGVLDRAALTPLSQREFEEAGFTRVQARRLEEIGRHSTRHSTFTARLLE